MKISKKFWLLLACWFAILGISFSFALNGSNSLHPRRDNSSQVITPPDINPAFDGTWVDDNSISQWSKIFSDKLKGIIHIPQSNEYSTSLWYVIALIQIAINRLLWILAFVALVYMLYNWFLVLTSGSDSKNADKWKKWISTAAIALAWIGLSWLIISAILWIIGVIAN